MEKMGNLKKGNQKTHFGPHGDQSPLKGTNVGAVGNYNLIHQCVVGIGGPALVIGIMSKWWLHVKQSNQNWRDQATKIAPLCHTDCLLDTL